jgi:hypothetical protein
MICEQGEASKSDHRVATRSLAHRERSNLHRLRGADNIAEACRATGFGVDSGDTRDTRG